MNPFNSQKFDNELIGKLKQHLTREQCLTLLLEGIKDLAQDVGADISIQIKNIDGDKKVDQNQFEENLLKIITALTSLSLNSKIILFETLNKHA